MQKGTWADNGRKKLILVMGLVLTHYISTIKKYLNKSSLIK